MIDMSRGDLDREKVLIMELVKRCPDWCPACGACLRRQGYPFVHQHDYSGEECTFQWEPTGALDPGYDPDA